MPYPSPFKTPLPSIVRSIPWLTTAAPPGCSPLLRVQSFKVRVFVEGLYSQSSVVRFSSVICVPPTQRSYSAAYAYAAMTGSSAHSITAAKASTSSFRVLISGPPNVFSFEVRFPDCGDRFRRGISGMAALKAPSADRRPDRFFGLPPPNRYDRISVDVWSGGGEFGTAPPLDLVSVSLRKACWSSQYSPHRL